MIQSSTNGFTVSGEENLSDKPTLFIGNHRDIALDAAFLNYTLFLKNFNTARIAIGDNLLDGNFAEDLMRLNKSFVVHRSITGIKETYKKLLRLSSYIEKSICDDKESVWIAQRQGRAGDGNDATEIAVLKMLYLSSRKKLTLEEWLGVVNLTPVVISYEYDPLDIIKAKSSKRENKGLDIERDINELIKGIRENKGRVHLHICKPLTHELNSLEQISKEIDSSIHSNYRLWPTNHSAVNKLSKTDSKYESFLKNDLDKNDLSLFMERFKNVEKKALDSVYKAYAKPVLNKKDSELIRPDS